MVGNFEILCVLLLRGEWYFANHLRVNQSECATSTFYLFGIY